MSKGSKIKNIKTGKIYTLDSILEMDNETESVIFTEEGVCIPVSDTIFIEEESSIFDSVQNEELLKLQFKIFGCSSVEERLRRKIFNEKERLGLLKFKYLELFGYTIIVCIDDRSKFIESYHIHVNLRSQFVFRTKNKTYSLLIEKSK